MRGRAVLNVLAACLLVGLLVAGTVSGAVSWATWGVIVGVAILLGVAVAEIARPPAGWRGGVALVLLVGPILGFATLGAAHGLTYVLAPVLGAGARRLRFEVLPEELG